MEVVNEVKCICYWKIYAIAGQKYIEMQLKKPFTKVNKLIAEIVVFNIQAMLLG